VIRNVEHLPPRLQPPSFVDEELPGEAGVEIEESRADERVAAEIPVAVRPIDILRYAERRWIEPSVDARLRDPGITDKVRSPVDVSLCDAKTSG